MAASGGGPERTKHRPGHAMGSLHRKGNKVEKPRAGLLFSVKVKKSSAALALWDACRRLMPARKEQEREKQEKRLGGSVTRLQKEGMSPEKYPHGQHINELETSRGARDLARLAGSAFGNCPESLEPKNCSLPRKRETPPSRKRSAKSVSKVEDRKRSG